MALAKLPDSFPSVVAWHKFRIKLLESKAWATCPCCHRETRLYRFRLVRPWAHALIFLASLPRDRWVYTQHKAVPRCIRTDGSWQRSRWWGLVESRPRLVDDSGSRKLWRITDKGREFVRGFMLLPSHAWAYDNKLVMLCEDGPQITIHEMLGEKFVLFDLIEDSRRGTLPASLLMDDDDDKQNL